MCCKCNWERTYADKQTHENECLFTLVQCSYVCSKDSKTQYMSTWSESIWMIILWKNAPTKITCVSSRERRGHTFRSLKSMKEFVIPCTNEHCPREVKYWELQDHIDSECEYTVFPCKYEVIGCDMKLFRKDMESHENDDKLHLHMAIDTTLQLKRELTLRRTYFATDGIQFKLPNFRQAKVENIFLPPSFYTHAGGYCMQIEINPNGKGQSKGTHVSIYVWIQKGEYDDDLEWPFVGVVAITLLNQD